MLEEREVITLILGLCAVVFFALGWGKLRLIPRFGLLLASYAALLGGWVLTIVEIYWMGEVMNVLEHGCFALSSAVLAWWCAVVALSREARQKEREARERVLAVEGAVGGRGLRPRRALGRGSSARGGGVGGEDGGGEDGQGGDGEAGAGHA